MRKVRTFLWCVLSMLVVLAGCTPEYNWRETTVADDRATIAFPSKVQTDQRSISLDGVDLKFTLSAASIGQTVFAVGFVKLPAELPVASVEKLTKGLIDSLMSRALRPSEPELMARALKGDTFELETSVAQQPSWLMGKVLVHQGMLLQVVVSGPKKELSSENAKEFMRSLVLK